MGIAKRMWMEQQEQDALVDREAWIRERLSDPDAEEGSRAWQQLSDEYDIHVGQDEHDYYEDDWDVRGKSRIEIFTENIAASGEILTLAVSKTSQKNLLVMLHAHVVTTVEAYLSSTFIELSLGADEHMRKLVETDPEFARRKFTIQEIFTKRESLRDDLRSYLKDLIFHDIAKVKAMYDSVFGIDFGDVKWLFGAVLLRHDCVHRAGYDKDGNEAPLTVSSIQELIGHASALVTMVEDATSALPKSPVEFWKMEI